MSIELNLAVMSHGNGEYEVQPCQGTTCEEASKEWESDVVRVCQVVLEDKTTPRREPYSHMEGAWEAVEAMDNAYDYPCIRDMLMHFFMKGFQEGMKHQTEQAGKSIVVGPAEPVVIGPNELVTVAPEEPIDEDPHRRTHN